MPDIYHITNFVVLIITALVGWVKLRPKDWTADIVKMQQQIWSLEKSFDHIEKAIDDVKDLLMKRGSK